MMQDAVRPTNSVTPTPSWTVITDAPLKGLKLAREAGTLLVWDQAENLWLLDTNGEHRSAGRCPGAVIAGSISDDGSLIALLGEDSRLWLLGADLNVIVERASIAEASALAIDPHGRFVAIASKLNQTQIYTRFGKLAGKFETRQPLAHLEFVPSRTMIIGTAAYGTIAGVELHPNRMTGKFDPEVLWQENLMSNVGRLAMSGDGGMILTACYTHGVQRYDLKGQNEGAYHLGGSPSHAVPDFMGRTIVVTTVEGELSLLSPGGQIRSRMELPRAPLEVAMDALGRSVYYGLPTGEIVKLDLTGEELPREGRTSTGEAEVRVASGGQVRSPDWVIPIALSDEQAEYAVVAIVDEPPRVVVMTSDNKLSIYSPEGVLLGQAPEIHGVGRLIRTSPGWVASATNKQIVLCDVRRNMARKLDLSLVELTHLALKPDSYGLGIVQERDRVGRCTSAGRWVFRRELDTGVEDLAIDSEGFTAVSLDDGRLLILDPTGEPVGHYQTKPEEPMLLIEAPEGSTPNARWVTLARRAQILRAHDKSGKTLWESPLPWEAWQLQKLGGFAVATAPDGRSIAFDGRGQSQGVGKKLDATLVLLALDGDGGLLRIARQGTHLIASELNGRVRWRAVSDVPIGTFAAGSSGVTAFLGRSLAYFPAVPEIAK